MTLATWWVQATPGVNYVRAEMPAKHLPGKTLDLEPALDVVPDADGVRFPRQEGAAIWLFPGNTTRALLMAEMKLQGIPVMVEVDDNYFRPPAIPQLSTWLTTRDKTGQDRHSYEVHKRIVPWVDGVICSTPYLADVYRQIHEHVHVCTNCVDPDDWPDDPPHAPDGVLRIGWAGSWSHAYDLGDIEPALDWAARQPNVEVVTIGYESPRLHNAHKRAGDSYHYRHIGWMDSMADYRRAVSEIDVMLCPIRPNAWANCKSDIKALEAAMGNACAVVSETPPYSPWWQGNAPGYSAATRKDYLKVVKHLVKHPDEARETARLAREYALTKRTMSANIHLWREAIEHATEVAACQSLSTTPSWKRASSG